MQTRLSIRVVVIVTVVLAGGVQTAFASGFGTRATLTARQQLRDRVCRATADGQITDYEYSMLINQAQRTLDANEFQSFQKSLDRLAQQQPVVESGPKAAIARRVQQTKALFTKLIPHGTVEQHEHPQIADAESTKPDASSQEAEDPQKPGEAFVATTNESPDSVPASTPSASKSMSATIKVVGVGHVAASR